MDIAQRWHGLDLFRGLAVYGVILLHADEGIQRSPIGWATILKFSEFAVPFFLATSFFLSVKKVTTSEQPYPLIKRINRLLIPYSFWTTVYVFYKLAKYLIDNESDKLSHFFSDPMGLILFGGAAFHLYFIPLLIAGTFLLKSLDLIRIGSLGWRKILMLWIISIAIYQGLLSTENNFNIANLQAFEPVLLQLPSGFSEFPLIRMLAVELAWIIRCLPYFLSALLICGNKGIYNKLLYFDAKQITFWIVIFSIVNGFGHLFIPSALHEIMRGYSALITAIAITNFVQRSPLVKSIGAASFGIYFMHLIILELLQIISNRMDILDLDSPSLLTLFAMSTFSFVATWILTVYSMKHKYISKLMFGN